MFELKGDVGAQAVLTRASALPVPAEAPAGGPLTARDFPHPSQSVLNGSIFLSDSGVHRRASLSRIFVSRTGVDQAFLQRPGQGLVIEDRHNPSPGVMERKRRPDSSSARTLVGERPPARFKSRSVVDADELDLPRVVPGVVVGKEVQPSGTFLEDRIKARCGVGRSGALASAVLVETLSNPSPKRRDFLRREVANRRMKVAHRRPSRTHEAIHSPRLLRHLTLPCSPAFRSDPDQGEPWSSEVHRPFEPWIR
jgi:hypothetical protein